MSLFKRGGKWYVRLRYNGRDAWQSTSTDNKRLAEQREAQLKLEMVQGRFGLNDEGNKRMFEEAASRFMNEYAVKKPKDSKRRDETSLKHLLPKFSGKYLSQITPDQIARYKVHREQENAAPASINHELALAKRIYNLGLKEWGWVRDNPFTKVSMEKVHNERVRYLTNAEYQALLNVCDDWLRPIVITAVNTGMRKNNLLTLTWKQVDFGNGVIILDRTKNNEKLGLPMSETLKQVLKALNGVRHINSPYVFTNEDGSRVKETRVQKHFKKACKDAGITDFRFHDLRHTFASWLVQSGVDLYTVQKLMGHKEFKMTQRYAHLASANLKQGIAVLDNCSNVVAKTVAN